MQIQESVSLKQLHTFHTDAKARYLTSVSSSDDIRELMQDKNTRSLPMLVLGGGSNVLFTNDYHGLVVLNRIYGKELTGEDEHSYLLKVGAGENWHRLVMFCIENNYAGLENLSLIPGCVGASPMQNIGAYGVEMKERFESLEAYHIPSGEIHVFKSDDCRFGYRESVFKREKKGEYIILSVVFRLLKKPEFNTTYGIIEQELEKMGVQELSIRAISDAVIRIRKSKLPDPDQIGNAGSFFKNPEVSEEIYNRILSQHPEMPAYKQPGGKVKLAAGWLIEKAGWKGFREGDYGVHSRQALVLVNYDNAAGSDLYELSKRIIADIEDKFNVTLEREVNIIQ